MKSKRQASLALLVAALFVFSAPDLASGSSILATATYQDVTTNIGQVEPPYDINTAIYANLLAWPGDCLDSCWRSFVVIPFLFSYHATIDLPQVGATISGGLVDDTFHATTLTHENWHYDYIVALANATYGALQSWSAGYSSCCFETEAAALATGQFDLARALQVAAGAYNNDVNSDVTRFELVQDANGNYLSYAQRELIDGVLTWRSVNPDRGQPAVDYANSVSVSFERSPSDPDCVPEPSTYVLVITVLIGMAVSRRRRPT